MPAAESPAEPYDVAAAPDPVAAVLEAHCAGRRILLRTSGTSSDPRAVLRTTTSWTGSFDAFGRLLGCDSRSRVWVPGPLHATMNLFAAVHATSVGATLVDTAEDATHAHLTPASLGRLLAQGAELAGVHLVVAGDRLGSRLAARAHAAGARTSHYYGAAELSFVAWGDDEEVLRPFPGVEVAERDGLLWVRSPYVCDGYVGAPGALRVRDGWASVGDRGRVVDGWVRVLGRGGDAITTAGATVDAADVELVLRDGCRGELVVLGLPHPDLGQVVAAVLTDAADHPGLVRRARRCLAPAQRPRRWFHLPTLPLTEAGKVDRKSLARSVSAPASDARRLV